MDSDHEFAAAAVVVAILSKKRKRVRKKRQRSVWVKPWLSRRNELSIESTLLREFRLEDDEEYKKFLRMSSENFDELIKCKMIKSSVSSIRCALAAMLACTAYAEEMLKYETRRRVSLGAIKTIGIKKHKREKLDES